MKTMKNIYKNQEELYLVYLRHFYDNGTLSHNNTLTDSQDAKLRAEFKGIMRLNWIYFPYWFVVTLDSLGYELKTPE
mgnify:FL=1